MKTIVLIILSITFLSGCEFIHTDKNDIDEIIAEKRGFAMSIAKKPNQLDSYKTFTYTSFNERDPFEKFVDEKIVVEIKNAIKPDFERKKGYLEQFELSELVLTGIMKKGNANNVALFFDGFQNHISKIDDYLGKNFGKIVNIESNKVHLEEIYKDEGVNVWVKKEVILEINSRNTELGKNNKLR